MRRRTVLATIASLVVAGCTISDPDEESTDVAAESAADEEPTDDDLVDQFLTSLESDGFERVTLEPNGDVLVLGYDATGPSGDDVAVEIERVADGYTTTIEEGLPSDLLEATAYHPDSDDALDYFAIEADWVDAYLAGDLEWPDLLGRIGETFVSLEAAEDDESDGAEDDESEDQASADSENESDEDESSESQTEESDQTDDTTSGDETD